LTTILPERGCINTRHEPVTFRNILRPQ